MICWFRCHIRGGRDGDGHCDLEDYGKSGKGVGLQGQNVVKDLTRKLQVRGHILTTNNFFTSVLLFLDLLDPGIMDTCTLRSNRKYLPREIWAKKTTKTKSMGWCDWQLHNHKRICCMVWKDKKPVLLLSTHAEPISPQGK